MDFMVFLIYASFLKFIICCNSFLISTKYSHFYLILQSSFYILFYLFIYVAVLSLSCGMQDL